MPRFTLLALLFACVSLSSPQTHAVRLDIRFTGGTNVFHQGEVIPLELSFSSSEPKRYQIDLATHARSALDAETYAVSPADGTADPLRAHFGALIVAASRLGRPQFLGAKPATIRSELNEWVRFNRSRRCVTWDPRKPQSKWPAAFEAKTRRRTGISSWGSSARRMAEPPCRSWSG